MEKLILTGIDAATGKRSTHEIDVNGFYKAIDKERTSRVKSRRGSLETAREIQLKRDPERGLRVGLDPMDLSSAGWGLAYPEGTDPLIVEALDELVRWRNGRKIEVPLKFRDDAHGFRKSMRELSSNVDPRILPYYMLLVGSPEEPGGLSFRFQHSLSDVRPVGRLAFSKADQYASYASKLIECE